MVRLAASAVVSLIASAIALLVASLLLEDVALDGAAFAFAVLIFAASTILLEPLLRQVALRNAPALTGGTALVSTLLSLIVTDLLSDGLSISGTITWLFATVIVWLVALAARLVLPYLIFRRVFEEARDRR